MVFLLLRRVLVRVRRQQRWLVMIGFRSRVRFSGKPSTKTPFRVGFRRQWRLMVTVVQRSNDSGPLPAARVRFYRVSVSADDDDR
ncbi:hypothetical protein HanXRQr2_Chr14g0659661 [Helianthus annuus]|uniref:Uncharacterized protein n=1 Tax=Helianthus annuus TaxID=4232 RepID=A0A251SKT5_HELAN|nr:hypothetical protein HanXRQr2_Chr14g0659661 [Helianthus annuus]